MLKNRGFRGDFWKHGQFTTVRNAKTSAETAFLDAIAVWFRATSRTAHLMSDVTGIVSQIESGDPSAAEKLLPLVYEELRKLAAAKLAREKPGQTLQPTALVHEAYLRLLGSEGREPSWENRGHFFAAAAEAMRRILVDSARRKGAAKRSAQRHAVDDLGQIAAPVAPADLLALDDSLKRLAAADPKLAELVELRYFAGMTNRQAADCLGISSRTADNYWAYAKAWLLRDIEAEG